VTKAEARKAIRWFQKRAGITDWKIALWLQDAPPDWERERVVTASATHDPCYKRARIWISASRASEDGESLLKCLFHECLHIAGRDAGFPFPTPETVEYLIDHVAEICEAAYLAETNGG